MEESSGDAAGKGYFLTVLETIDDTPLIPWQPPFKSWSFCTASLFYCCTLFINYILLASCLAVYTVYSVDPLDK
jgi:hypothetical protein